MSPRESLHAHSGDMYSSSRPKLTPPKHEGTMCRYRWEMSTTIDHQQRSLPTPTTSMPGCEMQCIDCHSPADALSSHVDTQKEPRRARTDVRGGQNVCAWLSGIEGGKSPGEDRISESPSEWTYQSQDKSLPTADSHLATHNAYDTPMLDSNHGSEVMQELMKIALENFSSADMSTLMEISTSSRLGNCRKSSQLVPFQKTENGDSVLLAASDAAKDDTVHVTYPEEPAPQVWLCPFFVRDREWYRSCFTRHCLLSIQDLREHLCSEHLEPIYCSVCYKKFETVKLRDTHMQARKCHHQLPNIFNGLKDSQVQELEKQRSAADKISSLQTKQWIKIWSIVFSCTRPPSSSFSFTPEEVRVYQFRRFWEKYGESIIGRVLASHGLQQYHIKDEERHLDALFLLVADRAVDFLMSKGPQTR